jgi:hypothetical protein
MEEVKIKKLPQIGGTHYQMGIPPIDYIEANNLSFIEGNIVKYVSRYKDKNGIEDLQKAKWYLEKLISNYEQEKKAWVKHIMSKLMSTLKRLW